MVLSKREKYIGIGVITTLAILLINWVIIVPLEDQRNGLEKDIARANSDVARKITLIKHSRDIAPRWNEMNRSGLMKDASAAESQIYNQVASWAREANLVPPPALKSDRTEKEAKEFQKITWRGTGNGQMSQIARFLWHIQTANFPVRVTDLTITSRKEGADDLSLQLGLATVYVEPDQQPKTPAASVSQEVSR